MAGKPQVKLRNVANLCEWFTELAVDFDTLLPPCYRFNGEASTGDARRDAWSNADKCIVMTGAALTELEAVLRSDAIERAKPRGKPKTEVVADVVEVKVAG